MNDQNDAQPSLVIVLHTSVKTMLKCIGMQNLIKIDHVIQSYEHMATTHPRQTLVTILHTSVSAMLKCIRMQNLIKTYGEVEEL